MLCDSTDHYVRDCPIKSDFDDYRKNRATLRVNRGARSPGETPATEPERGLIQDGGARQLKAKGAGAGEDWSYAEFLNWKSSGSASGVLSSPGRARQFCSIASELRPNRGEVHVSQHSPHPKITDSGERAQPMGAWVAEGDESDGAVPNPGAHQLVASQGNVDEPAAYLDCAASHHQLNTELMDKVGTGAERAIRTEITGVNASAPLRSTSQGTALWPLGADQSGRDHDLPLESVLNGEDITGPGLVSLDLGVYDHPGVAPDLFSCQVRIRPWRDSNPRYRCLVG